MKRIVVLLALALTLGARGTLVPAHSVRISWDGKPLMQALNPSLTYDVSRVHVPRKFYEAQRHARDRHVLCVRRWRPLHRRCILLLLRPDRSAGWNRVAVPSNQGLAALPPAVLIDR